MIDVFTALCKTRKINRLSSLNHAVMIYSCDGVRWRSARADIKNHKNIRATPVTSVFHPPNQTPRHASRLGRWRHGGFLQKENWQSLSGEVTLACQSAEIFLNVSILLAARWRGERAGSEIFDNPDLSAQQTCMPICLLNSRLSVAAWWTWNDKAYQTECTKILPELDVIRLFLSVLFDLPVIYWVWICN